MEHQPRITGCRVIAEGHFLQLQALEWTDGTGAERTWESAARVGGQAAVVMIALLRPSDRVILVRQFRPPAEGDVLEFPAGLIDGDETPESAAVRELREETGYVGRVRRATDFAYNSPGMSSERTAFVHLEIDEAHPDNAHPAAAPDEGEAIEVLVVARGELLKFCEEQARRGTKLDSKVMAFALADDNTAGREMARG